MQRLVIRTVRDGRVDGKSRAEARSVFLKDDMDGGGDTASFRVVHTVPWGVKRVANHDSAKRFSPSFRRSLSGTLAKTVHPKTRNLDASGTDDVRSVRGMPQVRPTERLYVRLRRYTTVLIAHDHIDLGTAMLWSIAEALSRIVRHGRSALPSMWWA
jgi:hypothetical protein